MTNTASLGGTPVDQANGLEKEIKKRHSTEKRNVVLLLPNDV